MRAPTFADWQIRRFADCVFGVIVIAATVSPAFAQGSQDPNEPRPIAAADTLFIDEMTFMEVRDAIRAGKKTVIVGTGGVEQNGPYTATGKHNFVLRATTDAIARKLGDALIAPIVPFVPEGNHHPPSGHMRYAGTISVTEDTYRALLRDICASLKAHGFTNIVLIGDSGGNQNGMEAVAKALNSQWPASETRVHFIREYYTQDMWSFDYLKTLGIFQQPDVRSASRAGVHDDYHYEALVALVNPAHIRADERIKAGTFSINGVEMGSVRAVTENGRKLAEYRAAITAAAIQKAIATPSGVQ
jgi:creatinine amidohydrolase/Fe(II)-dependent formamide hydrolase-like protein